MLAGESILNFSDNCGPPSSQERCLKEIMKNFAHSLAAVIVGNLLYFFVMPDLPRAAQHISRSFDLGMAVDFFFCLAVLGIIKAIAWRMQGSNSNATRSRG